MPGAPWPTLDAQPLAIGNGDVNGDHRPDLFVGTSTGISVLEARGHGLFAPPLHLPSAGGASELAVGDFDADGAIDVAAIGSDGNVINPKGKLAVFFGNGDGTFAAGATVAAAANPLHLAAADFNRDGHGDLVVVNSDTAVQVLFGRHDRDFDNVVVGTGLGAR